MFYIVHNTLFGPRSPPIIATVLLPSPYILGSGPIMAINQ